MDISVKYNNCILYGLQSKQKMKELLHIKRDVYCKSSFINKKVNVYLDGKGRLIESPDLDIKAIQKNILKKLRPVGVPSYIFSGVSNRGGYSEIELAHKNISYTYCIDIQKFFYNISRNSVYQFFKQKLNISSDVASILTNYATIDLKLKNYCGISEIKSWIKEGVIRSNHLMTGSPISSLLSYYVNEKMFDEIYSFCVEQNFLFSVYADDLIISSENPITDECKNKIIEIIKNFGFSINLKKIRYYQKGEKKNIFNKSEN